MIFPPPECDDPTCKAYQESLGDIKDMLHYARPGCYKYTEPVVVERIGNLTVCFGSPEKVTRMSRSCPLDWAMWGFGPVEPRPVLEPTYVISCGKDGQTDNTTPSLHYAA